MLQVTMDIDDPEGPTKSKLALIVWFVVLLVAIIVAVTHCPGGLHTP